MLYRLLSPSLSGKGSKVYSHNDFFGYIVPFTWLIIGYFITNYCCYGTRSLIVTHWDSTKNYLTTLESGVALTIGLFVIVFLFVIAHIVGHILGNISSFFIDKTLIREVLGYPYHIYGLARNSLRRDSSQDVNQLGLNAMREKALDANYRHKLLGIVPLILVELYVAFSIDTFELEKIPLALLIVIYATLAFAHVGFPFSFKKRSHYAVRLREQICEKNKLMLLVGFAVLLFLPMGSILLAINSAYFWSILVFPLYNLFVLTFSIVLRKTSRGFAVIIQYLKIITPNIVYWLAKFAEYHTPPSRTILLHEKYIAGVNFDKSSDSYWLQSIQLDDRHGESFSTVYHFRSMYAMNRNLLSANILVLIYLVYIPIKNTPIPCPFQLKLIIWIVFLLLTSILFFTRYLYLYSRYYSKYYLRYTYYLERMKYTNVHCTVCGSKTRISPSTN
ncbi:MAG: hypothetical protein KAR44_12900 [Candidatus Aegiribacteria sp.]|nr:hypothetical protein [Candidatus Aegiribacteria sp.]